jgi:murein DD-endopeptidase MepM/ murein hydrolase activator NlpD
MAFAGTMTCLPTLPASAEQIQEEEFVATLQTVDVRATVALPKVERGEFAVQYYTVVQLPVPAGTRMGKRFSAGHDGVDFLPGFGAPIAAIADGVVTEVGNPEGALGVHVTIEHVVDGQKVYSTYGHMQLGSMQLHVGDAVARGQVIGAVGSTGTSTGPHLHFEIELENGSTVNPLPWLAAHVNI